MKSELTKFFKGFIRHVSVLLSLVTGVKAWENEFYVVSVICFILLFGLIIWQIRMYRKNPNE